MGAKGGHDRPVKEWPKGKSHKVLALGGPLLDSVSTRPRLFDSHCFFVQRTLGKTMLQRLSSCLRVRLGGHLCGSNRGIGLVRWEREVAKVPGRHLFGSWASGRKPTDAFQGPRCSAIGSLRFSLHRFDNCWCQK